MKFAIGCDHMGLEQKNEVIKYLKENGHHIIDCGTYSKTRTHYPIYGRAIALHVIKKDVDLGIAICGTGVGISNSCNKVKGTRTALVYNAYTAMIAREKYHANIISCGARVVGIGAILQIVDVFINTKLKTIDKKDEEVLSIIDSKIKHLNDNPNLFKKIIQKWEDGGYTNNQKQSKIELPEDKKE